MWKRFAIVGSLAAVAALSLAQERQPRGKAETTVSGTKVVVDYGRPALKGRSISDLMKDLPEDRIWRAGENQVTTLETAGPIQIGNATIPAGKYSLYVHAPAAGDWSLCVNKNLGVPLKELWSEAPAEMANEPWPMLAGYKTDSEVARIKMSKMPGEATDVFTIELESDSLKLSWGDLAYETTLKAGT
ncbi:MAG TPA: DUF2911 domain-containing protein [Vicinamibacteria bacterium]|nr:DUF2911 domain-containing protein [Vicinamibacteria bacterium]